MIDRRVYDFLRKAGRAVSVGIIITCVTLLILWKRSYSFKDRVEFQWSSAARLRAVDRHLLFRSDSHGLEFWHSRKDVWDEERIGELSRERLFDGDPDPVPDNRWRDPTYRERFMYLHTAFAEKGLSDSTVAIAIPHWAAISATVVPAIILVIFEIRRYRGFGVRKNGFCEGCGYDLRGSPTRCPECGMGSSEKNDFGSDGYSAIGDEKLG